jgi:hypothetical protein
MPTVELGDTIEQALTKVGITKERVSGWLGESCNCAERQEKLNQLSRWAKRIIKGKTQQAKEYLIKITE